MITLPQSLSLAAHLALGVAAGLLYFSSLWWNARLFAQAGRVRTVVASIAGRFVLLGGLLTVVSLEGALPLLVTAIGLLAGRFVVLRRIGTVAP